MAHGGQNALAKQLRVKDLCHDGVHSDIQIGCLACRHKGADCVCHGWDEASLTPQEQSIVLWLPRKLQGLRQGQN